MNKLENKDFGRLSLLLFASILTGLPSYAADQQVESCPIPPIRTSCKINCVDPHACCLESEKVIDTLQKMVQALTNHDINAYSQFIDENCTTFYGSSKKLISGKEAVIADVQHTLDEHKVDGPSPLVGYTIDHPYAKVMGDTAVVTFVAYREIGGKHPYKDKCNVTDVFVKRGDMWKKLHFRGTWKKV